MVFAGLLNLFITDTFSGSVHTTTITIKNGNNTSTVTSAKRKWYRGGLVANEIKMNIA